MGNTGRCLTEAGGSNDQQRRKRGIVLSDVRKIASCILKGIVVVSAAIGVILSALASAGTFMGGRQVFMYFRNYRTIRRHIWRCLFRHLLLADFSIYRQ